MGPTVKPNYSAMSKSAGVDKQVLQSSLSNFFQLIGDLLQEGPNVEVDLHEFGKFTSIHRQVIYAPLNKQKPSTIQGKQTVKSLMEIGGSNGAGKLSASA
jgi:nucleoid DNA-binding protein